MQLLIGAQVAFCVLVLFVAGLFTATSYRLSRQHTGFSAERLLTLETVTPQPQPVALWSQVADRLRTGAGSGGGGTMRVASDDWGKLERLHLGQWGRARPRGVLLPQCLAGMAGDDENSPAPRQGLARQ